MYNKCKKKLKELPKNICYKYIGNIESEQMIEELKKYDTNDVYIIGGETIYRQMLPYADVCHMTKIDRAYDADAYFPNLDQDAEWEITAESDEQVYFDTTYAFVKYERKK